MKDVLKERERGEELEYFRRQDVKLIEAMRKHAQLDDIAKALAAKLRVDDAELLRRVRDLGLDEATGPAILLAPLVQVAWAEGYVSDAERALVLELAALRGVTGGTPAHEKLLGWLRERPSDAVFIIALEVMRVGFTALPAGEREERIKNLVAACRRVASASGGGLARLIGVSDGVSDDEDSVLDAIATKLRVNR